jgi:septal ring factor EnvC (AmiA/AmiB activator)
MTVISPQGNGMNSETTQEQQSLEDQRAPEGQQPPDDKAAKDHGALRAELGKSQESVDALVGDLRALDAQLEGLAGDRKQHRLLHEVCDALGELGKLGGAKLFWGTPAAVTAGEDQLGRVREHVTAFENRVG